MSSKSWRWIGRPLPRPEDRRLLLGAGRFVDDIEIPGEFEVVRAYPRAAARQRAQSGLFTRLRSTEHLEVVPYFASRGLTDNLVAYDIPIDAASHATRDLQLMNITPATLFPDLHGAAWQANVDNQLIHWNSLMYDWDPGAEGWPSDHGG